MTATRDDIALTAVLEGTHPDDDALQDAFAAAAADVAEIRRALRLLAAGTEQPRRRPAWLVAAAAIAVPLVVVVSATLFLTGDSPRPPGRDPGPAAVDDDHTSWTRRVALSEVIVVGRVEALDRGVTAPGAAGETGEPYVLATVSVEERIKGAVSGELVAYGYDITNDPGYAGHRRPWTVGDRVVLFLVADDAGDGGEHPALPPHHDVVEGEAGRYVVAGDVVQDADFTLEDLRREVRA